MRVEVLTPWTHNGEEKPVGSFVELAEADVRMLRGTVGQEDVPEDPPPALPAPMDLGAGAANGVRLPSDA